MYGIHCIRQIDRDQSIIANLTQGKNLGNDESLSSANSELTEIRCSTSEYRHQTVLCRTGLSLAQILRHLGMVIDAAALLVRIG